jgi:guanylate kinase
VERLWLEGKHVLFDVDVVGGLKLKAYYKEKALALFVKTPTLEILENRLRKRGTETEESLSRRLEKVKKELSFEDQFDSTIINDDFDAFLEESENRVAEFIKK